MASAIRILSGKGDAPWPLHATLTVPADAHGGVGGDLLALRAPDGSEGIVVVPPDAPAGETLRVIIPTAYPNWGANAECVAPSTCVCCAPSFAAARYRARVSHPHRAAGCRSAYDGDWVSEYSAGDHAPGRGTWGSQRPLARIHCDASYNERKGLLAAAEPGAASWTGGDARAGEADLDRAAWRFREAGVRRDEAQTRTLQAREGTAQAARCVPAAGCPPADSARAPYATGRIAQGVGWSDERSSLLP